MSPIKIILSIVIVVPLLLIAAALFLLANPDYYRRPLATTFEEETGLVLMIGEIGWRYWPPIGLRIRDAQIHPQGSATPLAEVEAASVDLDLLPLITGSREIAIRGIDIAGLAVNLIVDDEGRGNWERPQTPEPVEEEAAEPDEEPSSSEPLGLAIDEVEITDVRVRYTDATSGSDYSLRIERLATGTLLYDEPTAARFTLIVTDHASGIESALEGEGSITFNQGFSHFAFSGLDIEQRLTMPDFPPLEIDLTLDGAFDVAGSSFDSSFGGHFGPGTFQGSISAEFAERPDARFDIELDRLDAASFGAGEAAGAEEAGPEGAAAGPPQDVEVIPAELLRGFDLSGKLRIGSLAMDALTIADVAIELENRDGRFTTATSAKGYDGSMRVTSSIRTSGAVAGTVGATLEGFDIARFTEFEWISGTLSADSNSRFSGSMLSEILDTLDGKTTYAIDNGSLDVTAVKNVAAAVDTLRGKQSSVSGWPDRMPFEHLTGELELRDGIEARQRLSLQLENMTINGRGGIDYFGNELAYDLRMKLVETTEGPFQVSSDLARIELPVHCEGALDASPADLCRPDADALKDVVADTARQEVRKRGEESVKEKVQEKLKNLFKR